VTESQQKSQQIWRFQGCSTLYANVYSTLCPAATAGQSLLTNSESRLEVGAWGFPSGSLKNVDSLPPRAARSRRVKCASRAINATLTFFPPGETAKGSVANNHQSKQSTQQLEGRNSPERKEHQSYEKYYFHDVLHRRARDFYVAGCRC
jgi:hypothetical protein